MQKCFSLKRLIVSFSFLRIFILSCFLAQSEGRKSRRGGGYDSSFAFLNVRSPYTPDEGVRFCVNYQQYSDPERLLPASVEQAKPLRLSWWMNKLGKADICPGSPLLHEFTEDEVVPANYRENITNSACTNISINTTTFSFMDYEAIIMKVREVSHSLYLVDRGRRNKHGHHDYLFSLFSNPVIGEYGPNSTFYIYNETFLKSVLPLIYGPEPIGSTTNNTVEAKLSFYRPISSLPFDAGLAILCLLAISSVLLGSVWGAYDTWAELNIVGSRLREESSVEDLEGINQREGSSSNLPPSSSTKANTQQSDVVEAFSEELVVVVERRSSNLSGIKDQNSSSHLDLTHDDVCRASAGHDVLFAEAGGSSAVAVSIMEDRTSPKAYDKPKKREEQKKAEAAAELAALGMCAHCCYVMIFLVWVGTLLMVAFFFRNHMIMAFNFVVLIFGTISVHKCVYTILQIIFSRTRSHGGQDFDVDLFSLGQIFCSSDSKKTHHRHTYRRSESNSRAREISVIDAEVNAKKQAGEKGKAKSPKQKRTCAEKVARWDICSTKLRLLSLLLFCGSAAFCLAWFLLRENAYSFIMLDAINYCLCIFAIRGSMCRSMRLITFLMMAMFVYDLFMVFGTTLVTSDGCSVMLQVATGMACPPARPPSSSADNSTLERLSFVPTAPIDLPAFPPRLPIVFHVPYISDPMRECFDVEIEKGLQSMMILGLGDVIIPGFLVAYCFYIDVAKRHRFFSFGMIAWFGYIGGLLTTFIALHLMQVGQPALIYLVPCTLIPVHLWAWHKGMVREIWRGGDLTRVNVDRC